jgi:hypothetical protein
MLKIEGLVTSVNFTKQSIANKKIKKSLSFYLTTETQHVILLITARGITWKRKLKY